MAARMLRIQITGLVSPTAAQRPVARGDYLATEIKPPAAARAVDLRDEPVARWRLRKLDAEGRLLPAGPQFVLSFRDLAGYIEARHMRVVEGDFV